MMRALPKFMDARHAFPFRQAGRPTLKIAAPTLGFNGVGGILLIIPFLLGGRFPHLFTILLVCWLVISLELLESPVYSTLMIAIMANCRWHSIRVNMLP